MRLFTIFNIAGLVFILSSCASVPKETVELNKKVSQRIETQEKAHKSLVNEFIALKQRQVDSFIHNTYLPTALKNFRQKLEANDMEPELTSEMIDQVMKDVMKKRDQMQSELETLRVQMITQIEAHYLQTLRANQRVTDVTASAAKVEESREAMLQTLDEEIGDVANIREISGKVDEYLKKAGKKAGEVEGLLEYLEE